jgi:hypothetical protein
MKKFNQKQEKFWFLKKKNFSQKIHILAHSGGRNITEIIFWHILSHCGTKRCIKCVKSLLKMVNFFRKSWKICTMGRFLKKSHNDFFLNLHFWNVGKVLHITQSRDILKYELSKFRLKNSPWFWFESYFYFYALLEMLMLQFGSIIKLFMQIPIYFNWNCNSRSFAMEICFYIAICWALFGGGKHTYKYSHKRPL